MINLSDYSLIATQLDFQLNNLQYTAVCIFFLQVLEMLYSHFIDLKSLKSR
jgi:hypothetical protein